MAGPVLGPARLDLAEEMVQEAMLRALQAWPLQGVPQNPESWLFRVAHNAALDLLRREGRLDTVDIVWTWRPRRRFRPIPILKSSSAMTSCA